jgi:CRP-like cAMP-binding protein
MIVTARSAKDLAMLDTLSVSNRILARLPRREYQRVLPALELVNLKFGQMLYRPGETMKAMYFPNDSMVSLMTPMGEGQVSEVGLVGKEGVVGVQLALGASKSSFVLVVQGAGTAMCMDASRYLRELERNPALRREVLRFTHLQMIQFGQTAGCNRYHPVSQRLARWLLMTRDRMNSNEFKLTQEFLASMLGVQRPRVSGAAAELKKKRLIRYSRGTITILDEKGLLNAACVCYERLKTFYRDA